MREVIKDGRDMREVIKDGREMREVKDNKEGREVKEIEDGGKVMNSYVPSLNLTSGEKKAEEKKRR